MFLGRDVCNVAVLMDSPTLLVGVGGLNFDDFVTQRTYWIAGLPYVGHGKPSSGGILSLCWIVPAGCAILNIFREKTLAKAGAPA